MIWTFRKSNGPLATLLAEALGQPLKMGEFLVGRNFAAAEEVLEFIRADLKNLPPPKSFTDMDKAVKRLLEAKTKGETVAICGDYDADGLTATAVLTHGFRQLGLKVYPRVPHRLTEGYGLKDVVIPELVQNKAKLVVTVDNGISEHEAIEAAVLAGLDVIITDHHKLPSQLPSAVAIINPHRDPLWKKYPPAGVGVAFFLLSAFNRACREAGLIEEGSRGLFMLDYLPLVAIGTIADMVPLAGPNRILVRQGLALLATTTWPGLVALKQISGVNARRVTARDVGFSLAPRLNAAGRLGSAKPALDLLLAENQPEAQALAIHLGKLNQERYQGQRKLSEEVLERLEVEISPGSRTAVLAGYGWPRGLLGLAASRVAELHQKPTVLFSIEDGLAVGSGRSAGNFNLYKALNEHRHLFIRFGGHAQAAGLTLKEENLEQLRLVLEETAQNDTDFRAEAELMVDLTLTLSDIKVLGHPLAALEPFGQDNPSPVVVVPRAKITEARPTNSGGDRHMKMIIHDELNRLPVIGFNLAPRLCEVCREMDVALTLDVSECKGAFSKNSKNNQNNNVQLNTEWRLVDFRPPADVEFEVE